MPLHPLTHALQTIKRPLIELTAPCRTYVQQEIAALAHSVDQHANELLHTLPTCLIAVVSPRPGECLTGLPNHRLTVDPYPFTGLILLGRLDVPAFRPVHAIVEHYLRLQLTYHLVQFLALPVVTSFTVRSGIAVIQPQNIQLAKPREQLSYLPMQILSVFFLITLLVQLFLIRSVAHGVDTIDYELRMVPVDEGVVKADPESLSAKSADHGLQKITPCRSIGGLILRQIAVPKAESVMVLRRYHEVLHACIRCGFRPELRIIEIRIEVAEVLGIGFIRDEFP